MNEDELYMSRCLELAVAGSGYVAPNPMVGAVIVYEGKIIGEGYHQAFGESHAEINAIEDARNKSNVALFSESTMYVSLEPCSHVGKTPACTDALIANKFKRIVIACEDPNELVSGKGIKILKESGTDVTVNVLKNEALKVNCRFMTFHKKRRPYIILKYAKTKDNFIAAEFPSEENRWITNNQSRKLVHRWRSEEQAVMVGTNTALIDNPALTLREWPGKQPIRIVVDRKLKLPKHLKLFDQSVQTLVFNEVNESVEANIEYVRIKFNEDFISGILNALYKRSILSMMIEGGTKLLQSFIDVGMWDEIREFEADKTFDNGMPAPIFSAELIKSENIETDILRVYKSTKHL